MHIHDSCGEIASPMDGRKDIMQSIWLGRVRAST
ncbi:hypothetical protein GXY_15417 [Novacetimonas hansenii ATCC 23769]|uniref:Uncharacterized protein n=1 Tax=Novacetimonas hansenii ATCC 23769 TaxID=714995 RepID=D5QIV2_NOVHA|nr:hypothetical protein GXY_15417 [Novacetimonas hansenii ATCC 23769]